MNERDDDKMADELDRQAAALPRAVAPSRDLWPGIEQAITAPMQPARRGFGQGWAQAAMVLLLVGASSGITFLLTNESPDATTPVAQSGAPVFEVTTASFGADWTLGPDYLEARETLAGSLDEQLDALSPETRDEVRANLQTIRQAISNMNNALADEPDNVLLQELLLDTYRDELELMIRVDDLTRAAMRRGDI